MSDYVLLKADKIDVFVNPLTPNDLKRRRAVKLKSSVKNLGMQRCADGLNSGVKGITANKTWRVYVVC
jgi:hypothetical protein